MKNININVTEEELKTIIVSIIARQESIRLRMQKYGRNSFDGWLIQKRNELDELDKLFYKLLIYVDEVS